jgi:hypothetical protein
MECGQCMEQCQVASITGQFSDLAKQPYWPPGEENTTIAGVSCSHQQSLQTPHS